MTGFQMMYWYWWALALALAALEIFIPGAAFLWVAGAAALVGLIALVSGIGVPVQVALFGILAVAAWFLSRRLAKPDLADDQASLLNRRGDQYLGRVFCLEEALINGQGRARVGDSLWQVSGTVDLPVGAPVRVVGVDGAILRVEPQHPA